MGTVEQVGATAVAVAQVGAEPAAEAAAAVKWAVAATEVEGTAEPAVVTGASTE